MPGASKIWFITGASRGFGRLTSQHALEAGHTVIAAMRNPSNAGEVWKELQAKYGDKVLLVKVDTTKPEEIEAGFEKAKQKYGRIDVVLNNAGISSSGVIESVPEQAARDMMETNFWGSMRVTHAALKFMREVNSPPGGNLIQISSLIGRVGFPACGYYNASKFAFEGANEALYKELDPAWNIKLTLIEPGMFRTDFFNDNHFYTHPAYTANPNLPSEQFRAAFAAIGGQLASNNPEKLPGFIFKILAMEKPPFRVLAGKDAWAQWEENEKKGLEEIERLNLKALSDDLAFE